MNKLYVQLGNFLKFVLKEESYLIIWSVLSLKTRVSGVMLSSDLEERTAADSSQNFPHMARYSSAHVELWADVIVSASDISQSLDFLVSENGENTIIIYFNVRKIFEF